MRPSTTSLLGAAIILVSGAAGAQAVGPGSQAPERQIQESIGDGMQNEALDVVLEAPEEVVETVSSIATLPSIRITDIRLAGNTVLSASEVDGMTAPYESRMVSVEELHALRQELSQAYFDKGYVNSGVIIPDQSVSDGVVRLDVVEGKLTNIVINGNEAFDDEYIDRRVKLGLTDPLNITALQANLRRLQEEPLISSVNAQLLPGERRGDSSLSLTVNEKSPWQAIVSADNYRSASVAEERGTLYVAHNSLTGHGDVLSARYGLTDGVEDQGISYSFPISAANSRISAYYSRADSEIVEVPFNILDIRSNVEAWGITYSRPFIRELNRRVTGQIGFENKHSRSTLLGFPFSFSAGEENGAAEGSSIFVTAEWMERFESSVFAARGTLNFGSRALGSTQNNDMAPNSSFTQFIGQVQYIKSIPWRNSRLIASSSLQLTDSPLLAMYKFAIGGRYTVRGYRENLFVRDNGVTASVEYQVPIFIDDNGEDRFNLKLAPFVDWGRSWDENGNLPSSTSQTIASIGLGLLWNPIEGLNGEVYWGNDLDDQNLPTETFQDRSWHAQLSYQIDFGF